MIVGLDRMPHLGPLGFASLTSPVRILMNDVVFLLPPSIPSYVNVRTGRLADLHFPSSSSSSSILENPTRRIDDVIDSRSCGKLSSPQTRAMSAHSLIAFDPQRLSPFRWLSFFLKEKKLRRSLSSEKYKDLSVNLSRVRTGSLQITNSEEEDQGKYECVAENSLGIEISNVSTLHVRGELIFFVLFFTEIGHFGIQKWNRNWPLDRWRTLTN